MVNRVFCYSKEEAKKNGNRLPIINLVLVTFIFIVSLVMISSIFSQMWVFIIAIIAFMFVLVYYSVILGLRLNSRMAAYATDTEGNFYKAFTLNNGEGLYFAGYSVGSVLDDILKNTSNVGRDLGGLIGGAAQLSAMNKSAKIMSHPEIVAKIINEVKTITGAEVLQIIKVYSYKERKHSIKIKCDYKSLRRDKIKYNKNITIEKSYTAFNDMIDVILSKK